METSKSRTCLLLNFFTVMLGDETATAIILVNTQKLYSGSAQCDDDAIVLFVASIKDCPALWVEGDQRIQTKDLNVN